MARTKQSSPIIPPARRFHHVINSDKVFGTHKGMSWKDAELQIRGCLQRQGTPPEGIARQLKLSQPLSNAGWINVKVRASANVTPRTMSRIRTPRRVG
jgi:hypothetical protein